MKSYWQSTDTTLADAYILQSSKLARVTVVARSNYDVVNGGFRRLNLTLS